VIRFNTGRLYSVYGQRIAACRINAEAVYMVDVDRGIDYLLNIPGKGEPLPDAVLSAYDNVGWENEVQIYEGASEAREANFDELAAFAHSLPLAECSGIRLGQRVL